MGNLEQDTDKEAEQLQENEERKITKQKQTPRPAPTKKQGRRTGDPNKRPNKIRQQTTKTTATRR